MLDKLKTALKGYRTMISSAVITVAGAISAVPDMLQASGISWQSTLSQEVHNHSSIIIMGVAIFFGFMRWITTTPVGVTEPVTPPTPVEPVNP
jgi:hypothetical protein